MQLVRLRGRNINQQEVSCTGTQLAIVVNSIKEYFVDEEWFVADITTNDDSSPFGFPNENELLSVGFTEDFLLRLTKFDQFLSGIFVAISKSSKFSLSRSVWDTEEMPNNLDSISLEIHAFDASYFEVFSKEDFVLEKLSDIFQVSIDITEDL